MSVEEHGRKGALGLNFFFVSWGVLYVLGMIQPLIRALFGAHAGAIIILVLVILLQVSALVCVSASLYHCFMYFVTRFAAVRRANSRVEALRGRGEEITDELTSSIRSEEFSRDFRAAKRTAAAA